MTSDLEWAMAYLKQSNQRIADLEGQYVKLMAEFCSILKENNDLHSRLKTLEGAHGTDV